MNERSLQACRESRFGPFGKPLYDSYCFSRIPASIKKVLGLGAKNTLPPDCLGDEEYDFLIFFLLDGFGWKAFERHKSASPFLQKISREGILSKLTTQFPSTTASHITTLHTGLPVGLHGIYEWFCYEPVVDSVIMPLRYSFSTDKKPNTLLEKGVNPNEIFPFSTIYQELKDQGIASYIFQPKDIVNSPYSTVLQKGAECIGYKRLKEGLNKLKKSYQETTAKKAYFFFYYPEIDGHGHEFGPESPQTEKEIQKVLVELERFFGNFVEPRPKTCCILTADHGMTVMDPEKTLYLNKLMPSLQDVILKNSQGRLIVPCGSARDFFLHVEPSAVETIKQELKAVVQDKAEVYTTQELLQEKLFGEVDKRLLDRVGNLVILPYAPYSAWWYKEGVFENSYHGHHGGLSPEEMEIFHLMLKL